MLKTIIFDLDGTLLPMKQDDFVKYYFGLVVKKVAPMGIDKDTIVNALWAGTKAMIKNDGSSLNCDAFWSVFTEFLDMKREDIEPILKKFYVEEFNLAKAACKPVDTSKKVIELLKQKGYNLVLATNSLFPREAVNTRLSWVNLSLSDFSFATTYDVSSYCKPNLDYYREILKKQNLNPDECLMVGNNVVEDMCVTELGIDTYLVTDNIEAGEGKDISVYKNGGINDFYNYAKENL